MDLSDTQTFESLVLSRFLRYEGILKEELLEQGISKEEVESKICESFLIPNRQKVLTSLEDKDYISYIWVKASINE